MRKKLDNSKLAGAGGVLSLMALAGVVLGGMVFAGPASAQTAKGKTAGEVFKNVTTTSLKSLSVDDFMGAMGVITADLGLDCADCHPGAGSDKANWVFDTPHKIQSRKMIDMVAAINKANFAGTQQVTCWTCHHGKEKPATSITLDRLYGNPNDEKDDVLKQAQGETPAAQILDKYIAALGGTAKLNAVKSFVATGSSAGYENLGGGGGFQIFAKAPDMRTVSIKFKDHPERGESLRAYNGKQGWNKTPRGAVPEYELTGSELDGMRIDALVAFPVQLKAALTNLKSATTDLGDKDVYEVQGTGPNGVLVTMYFDKTTNLLVRMVRYSKSPVGRVPTQTDYADYRDVNGVKFPFSFTFSWLDGRDKFTISDVKVNVPVDEKKFGKPE